MLWGIWVRGVGWGRRRGGGEEFGSVCQMGGGGLGQFVRWGGGEEFGSV